MDPFYDPRLTYEQNLASGPFGVFAHPASPPIPVSSTSSFVGIPVDVPFGIPAGPLVNARFAAAAFAHGFDVCVYKTVRTRARAAHPHPNVLAVQVTGDLTPERAMQPLVADDRFRAPLSVSNSFGVPSRDPDEWQPDMARAVAAAGAGQVLVGGFQGTPSPHGTRATVADHVRAARLVAETGAPVLELNLSCPNEGTSALLCFDTASARAIVAAVKEEVGDLPLLVKLAYFADDDALADLVSATAEFVAGYAAVNTIPARLIDRSGAPALPGPGRETSGVCGAAIRWAGLEMTARLARLREQRGHNFAVIGTGGVMTAADYRRYRRAGADAVMSATGAMWNPLLAREVRALAA